MHWGPNWRSTSFGMLKKEMTTYFCMISNDKNQRETFMYSKTLNKWLSCFLQAIQVEGVTHAKGGDAIPGITKLAPGLSAGQGFFLE